MPTLFTRIATAAVVGGLTLGLASPALAEDDAPVDEGRDLAARCQNQIDRRLGDLATAQSRIAGVDALTDGHESTINGIIDATEAGLQQKAADIDATDDRALLAQLCTEIATEFRVYLVVLPQTHLTVGADRVDAAVDRGAELIAQLDEAIAAASEAGADVTEATTLRDQALAHLDAASTGVAGAADGVLTVTPTSYNDGDGATVIDDTRAAVRAAHGEIKASIEDGRAAAEAIRLALDAIGSDA